MSRGWGISGTISLSSRVNENVTLYLDTGGLDDLTITPYMLDEIVAHIESLGPRRIPWMFSFWSLVNPRYTRLPVFEQCNRDILSRLNSSSYDIRPGFDSTSVVSFPIHEYMEFFHGNRCRLNMMVSMAGDPSDATLLVGTRFLSQVVSVFDNSNNRIGICKRGTNPLAL